VSDASFVHTGFATTRRRTVFVVNVAASASGIITADSSGSALEAAATSGFICASDTTNIVEATEFQAATEGSATECQAATEFQAATEGSASGIDSGRCPGPRPAPP
jgi:hypothetical protein